MKIKHLKTLIFVFIAVFVVCVLFSVTKKNNPAGRHMPSRDNTLLHEQDTYISKSLAYARKKGFDTTFSILINYGMHSGKRRAFLVNPAKRKVLDSFLVSHGCGSNPWGSDLSKITPGFSNLAESHCSSLGRYKIGKRAYSDWGINIKYYLYGLDTSNSNAYKRTIVLHGWDQVGDTETYPSGTPEGWGCPAVSEHAMHVIDSFLQTRKEPVLMWVYH